jgi:hypothetical protein
MKAIGGPADYTLGRVHAITLDGKIQVTRDH